MIKKILRSTAKKSEALETFSAWRNKQQKKNKKRRSGFVIDFVFNG